MEVSQPTDHITHAVISKGQILDLGISDSPEFFQILSATLYTNQHLAVVREVLCNAWDAHIDAGITDTPIEITLDSNYLVVKDFGKGIPHTQIQPIYGVYGSSTKKSDKKSTGGFGLGCKAPFAYTDHFEVTSCHEGTRTIYNISKSSAQRMGKPGISTLAQIPTTETGLTVKIPVQAKDFHKLQEYVKQVVRNGEMLATFNQKPLPVIPFSSAKHKFLLTRETLLDARYIILVRYGTVVYPVPSHDSYAEVYAEVRHHVMQVGSSYNSWSLVLLADPDTISVTPSREALSLHEQTTATIKSLLQNYLQYKALETSIASEKAKILLDKTIQEKDYRSLFDIERWPFPPENIETDHVTDTDGLGKLVLSGGYPSSLDFRLQDLRARAQKAADAGLVDRRLAKTFLRDLKEGVGSKVERYYHRYLQHDTSDWLYRNVIGKLAPKLVQAGLPYDKFHIYGELENGTGRLTRRHRMLNLSLTRKTVVLFRSTAILPQRLEHHANKNPAAHNASYLCYQVVSRKAGAVEKVRQFFEQRRYEVIDLTERQEWEPIPEKQTRRKAIPFEGLPAVTSILKPGGGIDTAAFRDTSVARLHLLPTPEFSLVVPRNTQITHQLNEFNFSATTALVRAYGKRLGLSATKVEHTRALKHGVKDFLECLGEELPQTLMKSPSFAEHLTFCLYRVREQVPAFQKTGRKVLSLVYKVPELRAEFGVKHTATPEELDLYQIYRGICVYNTEWTYKLAEYIATIPLDPQNQNIIDMVCDNDLVDMMNIDSIENGLMTSKRQTYLDILIKAIKG